MLELLSTLVLGMPIWVWLAFLATVVVIGVEQGIVLAIVLSVIDHIRRSYRPTTGVVTIDGGHVHVVAATPEARTVPGLVVFRFNASLYYANANRFLEETTTIVAATEPEPVRWLCIDGAAVSDVDYSAGETLRQLHTIAGEHGARVVFVEVQDEVMVELERFGLTELFGADAFFDTVSDVIDAYRSTQGA